MFLAGWLSLCFSAYVNWPTRAVQRKLLLHCGPYNMG